MKLLVYEDFNSNFTTTEWIEDNSLCNLNAGVVSIWSYSSSPNWYYGIYDGVNVKLSQSFPNKNDIIMITQEVVAILWQFMWL